MVYSIQPLHIWKGFHWTFFALIQGLIVCLLRFEAAMEAGKLDEARIELETAADLMLASSAAMQLAGSFTREEYEQQVRPTMTPPLVQSSDFSGLMSWDHAYLIKVWKRLKPVFEAFPAPLHPQYDQFISAYLALATAHKSVCQKFGGDETGSLHSNKELAVETLDKITKSRRRLLDPKDRIPSGCPFHHHIESNED